MDRKIKFAGVILAAAFVFAVASASSASATSGVTPGTSPAILTGTQTTAHKLVLAFSGTTIKCTTSNITATVTGSTVTEITATPTYSGCTLGGLNATVVPNACQFTLEGTSTPLVGNVSVVNCGGEAPLTITQGTCVITIGNQGPLASITYESKSGSSPHDVEATLNVEKVIYTGGAGCPKNVLGERNDGKLTGGTTLRAYNHCGGQLEGVQADLTAH